MSTEDEKSKKLREIQDRLTEIQGIPDKSEESEKEPAVSSSKSKSAPTEKKKDKPVEKSKDETVAPLIERVTTKPKTLGPDKEIEKKTTESDTAGWSQNKVIPNEVVEKKVEKKVENKIKPKTQHKEDKKPAGKNRMSKILSIVSLAITLSVAAYIIYSYTSSPENEDVKVVEAEIPELAEEAIANEETEEAKAIEEVIPQTTSSDDADMVEETEKADVKKNENISQRVNAKRSERKEKIDSKPVEKQATTASVVKSSVPKGFIISYVSNGNSDAAANNVEYLRQQGFTANYYNMRDKDPKGPPFYKVYLGPYSSESEAFPDFKKIIKFNDKAFILRMD